MTDPTSSNGAEPGEESLAGLWSFTLQTLVARAAHDVNNALNGAVMNVEVVKARARPGADAGTVAPFAEAAAGQIEEVAALAGALLALGRGPRGTPDAALVLRHAARLLAPDLARRGIALDLEDVRACPVGGDPTATRLAIVAGLLAVADAAGTAETAGTDSADELPRRLRCSTRSDARPTVEIAPRFGATLPAPVARALAAAAVELDVESEMLRIALPVSPDAY